MRNLVLAFYLLPSLVLSQNPKIEFLLGSSSRGEPVFGLAAKDITNKGRGFYFHSFGFGAGYTGETNIDYGGVSDSVNISDRSVSTNIYGVLAGPTYRLGKNKNSNWSLYLGAGFAVKEDITSQFEYYVWDCCPELNEGNYVTYKDGAKFLPSIEALIGHEIHLKKVSFSLVAGYATTHAFLFSTGIIFRVPKKD